MVSFQNDHELRHLEKINFNSLALEEKENSTLWKNTNNFALRESLSTTTQKGKGKNT